LPRYFFHIRDGSSIIPDDEGMELSGMRAAHAEALQSADDLVRAGICAGAGQPRAIEIVDESGKLWDAVAIRRLLN
jgi:hypothetical protein